MGGSGKEGIAPLLWSWVGKTREFEIDIVVVSPYLLKSGCDNWVRYNYVQEKNKTITVKEKVWPLKWERLQLPIV